ncbi:MAG: uncharacterized membrane protein YbhN (UPF0104 family) [Myxococcota bacterium]|jgi:uncharacterized membrane protein YbhN (UPF0104 family)
MDAADFSPDRARKAIRRGLLTIAVSVVLLGVCVFAVAQSDLGREAIHDLITRARPGYLVISWVSISAAFFFMGLRWRALMPPEHKPPAAGLSALICAGLLLNYAVPGPFGELGAAWFAERRYRVPLADALASGVAARLVGLSTAAVMGVMVWAVVPLPAPEASGEIIHTARRLVEVATVVIGIGGVALFALAVRPGWWASLSSLILGRFRSESRLGQLAGRLDDAVVALAGALSRVATRGLLPYARALLWSFVGHTSVIIGISIAVIGLGGTPHIGGLAFTYATTTAGAVALFALPGSQVGWDALFVALLVATAGLTTSDALAVALLVRVQQLSLMVLGALSLTWLLNSTGSSEEDPDDSSSPNAET